MGRGGATIAEPRNDFIWMQNEEPHANRRKAILKVPHVLMMPQPVASRPCSGCPCVACARARATGAARTAARTRTRPRAATRGTRPRRAARAGAGGARTRPQNTENHHVVASGATATNPPAGAWGRGRLNGACARTRAVAPVRAGRPPKRAGGTTFPGDGGRRKRIARV